MLEKAITRIGGSGQSDSQSKISPSLVLRPLRGLAGPRAPRGCTRWLQRDQIQQRRFSTALASVAVGGGATAATSIESAVAAASTPDAVLNTLESIPLPALMIAAAAVRDRGFPARTVTFSPKVFIPLTRLCRDSCGYCTFAQGPVPGRRAYMTLDEVIAVAKLGASLGCTEALFTLGDKPEARWPEAAAELEAMGYRSTLEYVAAAAGAVLAATGLLPHVNAGVMGADEMTALKSVSVSQGLMLESLSPALLAPGGPHADCPDKVPSVRLAVLEAAGAARVPFTTGILVGIGESRRDRVEALLAIAASHRRHGHVQEVIIQNFRAKAGTAMAGAPEPPLEELLWSVAAARLILGPGVSIQAPPNLTPAEDDVSSEGNSGWERLIDAGINDWGGVSPLTRDFVNPERPWPHVSALAAATARAGKVLVPRLPVYPGYLTEEWVEGGGGASSPLAATLRLADAHGLARASDWFAGAAESTGEKTADVSEQPTTDNSDFRRRATPLPRAAAAAAAPRVALGMNGLLEGSAVDEVPPSPEIAEILAKLTGDGGHEPSAEEIETLFSARGTDFDDVVSAADALRRRVNGDTVTYVVNRNINYTNICTFSCSFCAFSKGPTADALRGAPYLLPLEEVTRRAAEAWDRGATEVCMQGGIHPDFTGDTYLELLAAAKAGAPDLHVHAFSPLEVTHGAETLGWSVERYLGALRDAGLGSLPGTAAEVLDDAVRAVLCPDKLSAGEWIDVVGTAHSVGLKTTSTIMFGHVDGPAAWATHLLALRRLAAATGGISEFVPLPFVHMEAPVYRKGRSRAGPTLREAVLMHAMGRLALHPVIPNIQASWVKMGPARAADLLAAGCNDMGGVLMNESITRAAGAAHGQCLGPPEMEAVIAAAGRPSRQRTTLYGEVPEERRAVSLAASLAGV